MRQETGAREETGGRKPSRGEADALACVGVTKQRWTHDLKSFDEGYGKVVGSAQELIDKAIALSQQWLKGIGYARKLVAKTN